VAEWLVQRGANPELPDIDRYVASARRGDRAMVEAMASGDPSLPKQLTSEHYAALHHAAETGDVNALGAMIAAGFEPSRPDEEIGKTALHSAAQAGQVEACRVLVEAHASVTARDREFHGTPLIWAADGARNHPDRIADYDAIAKLLLAAGAPTDWEQSAMPSDDLMDILERWRPVT
jgi:ankyrin repeat protein